MNARPADIDNPPCEALMPSGGASVDGVELTVDDHITRVAAGFYNCRTLLGPRGLRALLDYIEGCRRAYDRLSPWTRLVRCVDWTGPGDPANEPLSTGYRADPCIACDHPDAEYVGGDPVCYPLCDACLAAGKADAAGDAS